MTTLSDEAEAARLAAEAEQEALLEEQRKQLQAAARDAVKTLLVRADGTPLTFTDLGLKLKVADLNNGLVVWSDGTVSLGAVRDRDDWTVQLVTFDDGWTRASGPLRSLADLGEALAR